MIPPDEIATPEIYFSICFIATSKGQVTETPISKMVASGDFIRQTAAKTYTAVVLNLGNRDYRWPVTAVEREMNNSACSARGSWGAEYLWVLNDRSRIFSVFGGQDQMSTSSRRLGRIASRTRVPVDVGHAFSQVEVCLWLNMR